MSENNSVCRMLVIDESPLPLCELIQERVAGVDLATCGSMAELERTLSTHRPEVVLAFKLPGMTPESLAPLLTARSVKWIHNGGAGVEHFPRWDTGRLTVTNASGVLSDVLAEYVMASVLMMNIGFPQYWRQQAAHQWQLNPWQSVHGKNLLIVGLGNIGRRVAARAKAAGMRVTGMRARPMPVDDVDEMISPDRLPAAVAASDFIAVHVPLTTATHRLIDRSVIDAMPPHAVLINASRGAVVDEAALYLALKQRRLKGAVLDVFEHEPLPDDSPLWDLDNVVITPHMADSIDNWQLRMTEQFCANLQRWRAGQPLQNIVDPKRGY
ncbi:MAG: D-2-hydroxyacid dehydrogenase [Gammaproteobacteria bacterium]|nr:D-2-hydroxyacid dehydrogenase [Gammaproteobacteria bacterium]